MKVISAVDYGFRVVVRVVDDPSIPEWVHIVGEPRLDDQGRAVIRENGEPSLIQTITVPPGETGETCQNCRYNWDVTEVIFDGSDLYGPDMDGQMGRKTDEELLALAFTRAAKPMPARVITDLLGRNG